LLGVSIQSSAGLSAIAAAKAASLPWSTNVRAQFALILEPFDQPVGAAIAIVRRDDMCARGSSVRASKPPAWPELVDDAAAAPSSSASASASMSRLD